MGELRCRVCGLLQAEPIWGEDGTSPTFVICPCCGCEFGYEDASPQAVKNYRQRWLAEGARWNDPVGKPCGWNVNEQVQLAPRVYVRVLPGLPATGSQALQFSATGQGTHSEGFVVEFTGTDGSRWVGNFQGGEGTKSAFVYLPQSTCRLIIISAGLGYIVDADTRGLIGTFGGVITNVLYESSRDVLLIADWFSVECYGPGGFVWQTRRISWDGMANVRLAADHLVGEAYNPMDDRWETFEVNLDDGTVAGGGYPPELPQR